MRARGGFSAEGWGDVTCWRRGGRKLVSLAVVQQPFPLLRAALPPLLLAPAAHHEQLLALSAGRAGVEHDDTLLRLRVLRVGFAPAHGRRSGSAALIGWPERCDAPEKPAHSSRWA